MPLYANVQTDHILYNFYEDVNTKLNRISVKYQRNYPSQFYLAYIIIEKARS